MFVTLLVTASGDARAETATPPVAIRLSAHLHPTEVSIDTVPKYRVDLLIDLTNNRPYPIRLLRDEIGQPQNGQDDYYIVARRQDGRPIKFWQGRDPYTDRELKQPDVYRLVTVNPGQRLSEQANALSIYDMRQPGVYLIHVERKMPPELGGNFVSSNEITVQIPD